MRDCVCLHGDEPPMCELRKDVELAASSDVTILVTGEAGVGKKSIARLIHQNSRRRWSPLVTIDCALRPDALIDRELLEAPGGGTLLLTEVGRLSAAMQERVLRLLDGPASGGNRVEPLPARIIATTTQDLADASRCGRFLPVLFYRLNVIHLVVPPLRTRRRDIPALVCRLVDLHAARTGQQVPLSSEIMAWLSGRDWPGNIGELCEVVEGLMAQTPRVDIGHLRSASGGQPFAEPR